MTLEVREPAKAPAPLAYSQNPAVAAEGNIAWVRGVVRVRLQQRELARRIVRVDEEDAAVGSVERNEPVVRGEFEARPHNALKGRQKG